MPNPIETHMKKAKSNATNNTMIKTTKRTSKIRKLKRSVNQKKSPSKSNQVHKKSTNLKNPQVLPFSKTHLNQGKMIQKNCHSRLSKIPIYKHNQNTFLTLIPNFHTVKNKLCNSHNKKSTVSMKSLETTSKR